MAYSLQVDVWLELDEPLLAARVLRRLGELAARRGDFQAAIIHYQRADPLYRRYDQGWERIIQHLSFADALRQTGATDRSRELLQEALEDSERVDNPRGVATALDGFGTLALFLGRNEEARGYFRRALTAWEELGGEDAASTLHHLGLLAMSLGDESTARSHLQRAEVLRRRDVVVPIDVVPTGVSLALLSKGSGSGFRLPARWCPGRNSWWPMKALRRWMCRFKRMC